MAPNIISFFLITFFTLQSVFAQDCMNNLTSALPAVVIPEINLKVDTNSYFCFDKKADSDEATTEKFQTLKDKKVFDDNDCLIEKKYDEETSWQITELILATTKHHLNVYAADPSLKSENSLLVMTNSTNKEFVSQALTDSVLKTRDGNKLTFKDDMQIASAVIAGSLVGIVIERKSFRNKDGSLEHDKLLHSNIGALINLGSVAGSYLLIETAGVGDKLKLTKAQKKWAILLTGTVVGLLVGYGKERFYDYYHQDIHTYDPHLKGDMGATWLGGGAMNTLAGSISFEF